MRWIVVSLAAMLMGQSCFGWSAGGHHLISVMSFELLDPEKQDELLKVLQAHPRFAIDFQAPGNVNDPDDRNRWLAGRAGYWPDVARRTVFDRPSWHYQLGAILKIGDEINLPPVPGSLPPLATLETKELHIAQAMTLCRQVLKDKSALPANRALAVCWISHLVADAHQPCHSGSLYVTVVFPDGDRGANSIPTKQAGNLHSLWDRLLGDRYDAGDIRRRSLAIRTDEIRWSTAGDAAQAENGLEPLTWLAESVEVAKIDVYTPEILSVVQDQINKTVPMEPISLSEDYLRVAGEVARKRATYAAHRLAAILSDAL